MQIRKSLKNFLCSQDYYIDLFQNCLHVYYYIELLSLSDEEIELKLPEFILKVGGHNLVISNMDKHEILIKGEILDLRFIR